MDLGKHNFLSDLKLSVFFSPTSYFRFYQNQILSHYGPHFTGHVIEVGGELKYMHERFFPRATKFTCSNIGRDHNYYLDITNTDFESNSQDAYLCISVLEHVLELPKAIAEMERTLKPGGKILITIPFAYPYHDTVDYWRLSVDAYYELLQGFEIKSFTHLGGMFSSIVDNLRRPRKSYKGRYVVYKILALMLLFFGKILDQKDGFPLGYAIYAIKR
jgi:SAM-dependent methyltransferase